MNVTSPWCTGRDGDRHGLALAQLHVPDDGAVAQWRCVACKRTWDATVPEWTDDLPLYGDAVIRVSTLDPSRYRWSGPVRVRLADADERQPGPRRVNLEVTDLPDNDELGHALDELLAVAERIRGGDPTLNPEEWYAARDYARVTLNRWRTGGEAMASGGFSATGSTSTVDS